jgi:hypothetical protein
MCNWAHSCPLCKYLQDPSPVPPTTVPHASSPQKAHARRNAATMNIGLLSKVVSYDDIAAFSVPGSGRDCCAEDAALCFMEVWHENTA